MKKLPILLAMALSMPFISHAQDPHQDMLNQLGVLGGQAKAALEVCDIKGQDVQKLKQEQMQIFVNMGGSADKFNSLYQKGYDETKAEYMSLDGVKRKKMCDEFESFSSLFPPTH